MGHLSSRSWTVTPAQGRTRASPPKALIALLILLPSAAGTIQAETPLTLEECYQRALVQSETVAIDKEKLAETEAEFKQALGSALPSLDFLSVDRREENNAYSAFNPNYAPQRNFFINQPLFSGFKEFAAMSGGQGPQETTDARMGSRRTASVFGCVGRVLHAA